MFPRSSRNNVINCCVIDAVLRSKDRVAFSGPSNLLYGFCGQFRIAVLFPRRIPPPTTGNCIHNVVACRAFDEMLRIDAGRSIASMSRERLRPVPVDDIKHYSMSLLRRVLKPDLTIPIAVPLERPKKAIGTFMFLDGVLEPLEAGYVCSVKLIGHLRSFIATVLGRSRFYERSASFIITGIPC